MFSKWTEIPRVAAVGFALMISTVSLPTQAQESQRGTTMQEPASSGYAEPLQPTRRAPVAGRHVAAAGGRRDFDEGVADAGLLSSMTRRAEALRRQPVVPKVARPAGR